MKMRLSPRLSLSLSHLLGLLGAAVGLLSTPAGLAAKPACTQQVCNPGSGSCFSMRSGRTGRWPTYETTATSR